MKINELPDLFARRIEYPADLEAVRSQVGGERIDAPDDEHTRTLEELLAHIESDVYDSPHQLFESVVSSLPDEYVGRKFYDDRGWNPVGPLAGGREDADEQSF